jgi:NACHT domain
MNSHGARRTGILALALLFASVAAAVVVAHFFRLGVAQTLVTALIGGGTVPALYLTWATYRDTSGQAGALGLGGIADGLATAVGEQWQEEAAVRRLNDPYPLPVRWVAADPSLADGWDVLVKLASSGAGWPSSASSGNWARDPDQLAGHGDGLADVLERIPTRRLVVLGEPGAGKSMLMVRLVLDLLADRKAGSQVPVLASLASWNPGQPLYEWLGAQLITDYPALAAAAPAGSPARSRAAALLAAGLILPVLDGLDELPDGVRGPAITQINDALRPDGPLVVTSRTRPYADAIRAQAGSGTTLRAAAVVKLSPLDADAVADYLRADAGQAAARWDPVIACLGSRAAVGRALETPLMVGLARTIYNPRPGEHVGALPDPGELCQTSVGDRTAIEQHLFDGFIPAAYRLSAGRRNRWPVRKAEEWLVFTARHLEDTIGSPDLAWWQLRQALPPAVSGLAAGLVAGLAVCVAVTLGPGIIVGLPAGSAAGLAAGLAVGLAAARWRLPESGHGTRGRTALSILESVVAVGLAAGLAAWLTFGLSSVLSTGFQAGLEAGLGPGLSVGLGVGLAIGIAALRWGVPQPSRGIRWRVTTGSLAAGFIAGVAAGLAVGLPYGLPYGIASAIAVGLAVGLAYGVEGVPPDLRTAASPRAVLDRDRRAALVVGLMVGLGVGFAFGIGFPLAYALIVGFSSGLAYGLVITTLRTAWPSYALALAWLAARHRLPWSLTAFLADAHRRGVLRQAGAVYQFRHRELQRRLASRS